MKWYIPAPDKEVAREMCHYYNADKRIMKCKLVDMMLDAKLYEFTLASLPGR